MIKVKKLHSDATFEKAHETDTGYDLTAVGYEYKGNGLFYIKLGVATEPQAGHYFDLVPRSSFSKTSFIFVNNIGIIDEGYRGEWMFPVRHLSVTLYPYDEGFPAKIINDLNEQLIGKKIAQAILRKRHDMPIKFVNGLSATDRGSGGFGSTGV